MMHVPFSSYQAFSGQQKHKVEKVKKKRGEQWNRGIITLLSIKIDCKRIALKIVTPSLVIQLYFMNVCAC
jgi:hypothetical protein